MAASSNELSEVMDAYSGLARARTGENAQKVDDDDVDPVLAAYMHDVMKKCTLRLAAAKVSGFAPAAIESWTKDDYDSWSPWQPEEEKRPCEKRDHTRWKTDSNCDNTVGTREDKSHGRAYRALRTDLLAAARHNEIEEVRRYLEIGFDVNCKSLSANAETALHNAVIGGHPKMINFLVDQGADINATDDAGNTALHMAAQHGHVQCVRTLVKRGINKIVKNHVGYTAYQIAIMKGHKKVAKLLPNRHNQKLFKLKFAAALMSKTEERAGNLYHGLQKSGQG
jgi:hypothetical protein